MAQRDICYNEKENIFYIIYDFYINKYDKNGNYMGKLIEFKNYDIASKLFDGYITRYILYMPDNTFHIEIQKGKNVKIYNYAPTGEAELSTSNKIISLYSNSLTRENMEVIYKYEGEAPNISINVNELNINPNTVIRSNEEYIQYISLLLMSGEQWSRRHACMPHAECTIKSLS